MRKLTTLGVLALLLGTLTSPVFAGNEVECDVLVDGSPGLYGLCIAYHNAGNSKAMDKILTNYNKKRRPGDLPMPGTEPVEVTCPCLEDPNVVATEDWGFVVRCTLGDNGTDQGLFVNPDLLNLTTMFTTTSDGVVHMCDITQSPATFVTLAINADEYDECLFQLLMLCP